MFKQQNMEISPVALNNMVLFSSGLPLMMQQIGESVFWETDTNKVYSTDAMRGIIDAANEIGNKQIKLVLNQIHTDNYEPIIEKLVENKFHSFKRSDVQKLMKNTSENVISNFLHKMVVLGILEQIGYKNSGNYRFSNNLYYTYFLIKSEEKKLLDELSKFN